MKFILKLSYNGTAYHGWQRQDNAISIQQIIESALEKITGIETEIVGCGRTDTGVHARCYFAHFESEGQLDSEIVYKLNSVLPHDIAIEYCKKSDDDFHARFSATSREYRYFIHWQKNPFLINQSFFLSKKLDLEAMNQACEILMQYEDFASFCKKGADNKTTICQLMEARWEQTENQVIFKIKADRFLRNMVRAIVGAMVDVGLHKLSLTDFKKIIKDKNNQFTGTSVAACGLYLWDVRY
ncbi:MAG: tRNA pseudouridine(38-40) synthase TruA [Bacteroidia bacterium]